MDKLTWFKFVVSDWMMGKIQKCPEITQARFIRLCCLYWNKECILSFEDSEIEIDLEHLNILIAKKIVINSDGYISIKFLDEQNTEILELSEKRREAVAKRWQKLKDLELQSNTIVLKEDTIVIQSDTDKSRVDKSKIVINEVEKTSPLDFTKFINYFNSKANRKFRVTESVKSKLKARLKDYSKAEIIQAIDNAHLDNYHKETNFKYLTPEFILRPDKLEKFINQPTSVNQQQGVSLNLALN